MSILCTPASSFPADVLQQATALQQSVALKQAVALNRRAFQRALRGGPTWDRLVLTASSESQAEGYREEIAERRSLGLLPAAARIEVLADPPGGRPGSGGATFHVLRTIEVRPEERVLLLHCGGESRRLPAYGPQGKLFAPLPCPRADGRASTVFDEILVSLTPLAARMPPGWLVASADVLLLFHAATVAARSGEVTGIGFAVDSRTARGHGVYLPGPRGEVKAFLQKPTMDELQEADALRADGSAVVDTGIFLFPAAIADRLHDLSREPAGHRPSDLYEDWILPMVESQDREAYLAAGDPCLRSRLWEAFRGIPFRVRMPSLSRFVHLGSTDQWRHALLSDPLTAGALDFATPFRCFTGSEPFEESATIQSLLSAPPSLAANAGPSGAGSSGIGPPAIGSSGIGSPGAAAPPSAGWIGPGAIVESCRLAGPFRLEAGSIAIGVADSAGLRLPAGLVADQLPIRMEDGRPGWISRIYPVEMDPKAAGEEVRLYGRAVAEWLALNDLPPEAIWGGALRSVWNARLFPCSESRAESLRLALWLAGDDGGEAVCRERRAGRDEWRAAPRLSLEECASRVDRARLRETRRALDEEILATRARWMLDMDVDARGWPLAPADLEKIETGLADELRGGRGALRAARADWLMADLWRSAMSAKRRGPDARFERAAFEEIRRAVDQGAPSPVSDPSLRLLPGEAAFAEAPVRLDFAGGWSDTPPFSLEHGGAVLNVAALLDGRHPLRSWALPLDRPVLRLRALDLGESIEISARSDLRHDHPGDPFALHKAAIALLGIALPDGGPLDRQLRRFGGGLEVVTESACPKGSGLGTSSILGGVLLAALGKAMGTDFDAFRLFDLVLALEQRLTTGGGWQDQIGGLMGGWKITRTGPGLRQIPAVERPDLSPEIRRDLADRVLLFYTGYQRLARNILRNFVGSYLSRDARTLRMLHAMRGLVDDMAGALRAGDLDAVGSAMDRNNAAVASIDPQSWPPHVTQIVDAIRPHLSGAKPAGAGGGGFLILMAKSADHRCRAESILAGLDLPHGARAYPLEIAAEGLRLGVVPAPSEFTA